jgi:Domain of unknown function (DUF3291)
MATVSVTRLRLRSAWFLPAFILHAIPSSSQSKRADGCLGTQTRRASDGSFWTMTLWRDVEAMRAFMLSGAHRKAMPHLVKWCDEAANTRFDWSETTLPGWDEAERRLAANGKMSPVKHPSSAQAAGKPLGEAGERRAALVHTSAVS